MVEPQSVLLEPGTLWDWLVIRDLQSVSGGGVYQYNYGGNQRQNDCRDGLSCLLLQVRLENSWLRLRELRGHRLG